jgi:hypothetical protein
VTRKCGLCGVSIEHAERDTAFWQGEIPHFGRERYRILTGRDTAFWQGEMPLCRKKLRILKIFCEFKMLDKYLKIVELYSI